MAIDAKVSFLNLLEQKLSDKLTVDNMNMLMRTASDILEGFEMRETSWTEDKDDDLLVSFLDALKVQGRSQKTIDRYQYVIQRMMDHVKVPTRRVTVYHLRGYLSAEKGRGVQDSTLEGLREVFSSYFNWLQRESLIDKNPTANLGTIKCPKKQKKTFTDVDLAKLDMSCKTVRDKAILHFLGSTGCRISEMTSLDRNAVDLDSKEPECTVHGKGNKERKVYLDKVAAMFLAEYLESRHDDNPALFLNRNGKRIAPGGVRFMLNNLADAANVEHVHPHKFRRTLATDLTRHGMPIQEVARILGHDKIDTTMEYVVLDDEDVKASYRRFA